MKTIMLCQRTKIAAISCLMSAFNSCKFCVRCLKICALNILEEKKSQWYESGKRGGYPGLSGKLLGDDHLTRSILDAEKRIRRRLQHLVYISSIVHII